MPALSERTLRSPDSSADVQPANSTTATINGRMRGRTDARSMCGRDRCTNRTVAGTCRRAEGPDHSCYASDVAGVQEEACPVIEYAREGTPPRAGLRSQSSGGMAFPVRPPAEPPPASGTPHAPAMKRRLTPRPSPSPPFPRVALSRSAHRPPAPPWLNSTPAEQERAPWH